VKTGGASALNIAAQYFAIRHHRAAYACLCLPRRTHLAATAPAPLPRAQRAKFLGTPRKQHRYSYGTLDEERRHGEGRNWTSGMA
jgi:hypothetical protein